ncbi:GldG family protein [Treponema pectinovorum]|uniref:GldG family protein n=1 Tax=Treponema pectinovorum TaxID=164 RepID=UPI0011C7CEFC|nr:Gldg family protein [Treponema pectinovorum]
MKKFIDYIKNPKSDFILALIAILLLNLVMSKAYFRLDLTSPRSYSLSESSKQIVKTLEEPLSVKVFFSKNLPAPYNSVDTYIKDLLQEYKNAANHNFSVEFFDMEKDENQKIASGYGLNQIQIQELKNNEVGFKQAWMGLTVSYADRTENIDSITSSEGLEYSLTTAMSRLISTTSALAGLKGKAKLTLYSTKKLSQFNISGLKNLEQTVSAAYKEVNKKNMDRIDFEVVDPPEQEIPQLSQRYGIQSINWTSKDGDGNAILGLVLEYDGNFRTLPVRMTRSFFGNGISGLDTLEEDLAENLKSLVSKPNVIGYVKGHRELELTQASGYEQTAATFNSIISDRYEFKELNLKQEIPSGIKCIVVNGPKDKFEDEELYKLDQFLMQGGNLVFFADSFEEILPQGQAAYYEMPQYKKTETGLEKLFSKYGFSIGSDYVMDENCYVNQDARSGSTPLYFAPLLQKSNMDRKNPITKNLGYVIMLQNSSIDVSEAIKDKDIKTTILAHSSKKSWLLQDKVTAIPQMIRKPADSSAMKSENLAVLLEGKFKSAFEENPEQKTSGEVNFSNHYSKSVQNGKVFVVGTSKITTGQVMDESGKQPVAMFVRNTIDYMNGEADLANMRTKGLSLNTLRAKNGALVQFAKYFNQFGLVVLVAIAGLISLLKFNARKNAIRQKYNPDDEREIKN